MRAIGYRQSLPVDDDASLLDLDLPEPTLRERDLLVEVKAISVNPVDAKVRKRAAPEAGGVKVLGYDAAGIVTAVGPGVSLFKVGDEVFYAGAIDRPGTNSERHAVDERIVGRKPASLGFAEAAALPLTAITAWEVLFDRLEVRRPVPGAAQAVLVVGGAGGVGSIAVQLARQLTDLAVIVTASRPETTDWVRELGAHHVIDHRKPLAGQVKALGLGAPGLVFSTTQTDQHFKDIVEILAPQGRVSFIDDPDPAAINVLLLKGKSGSLRLESMFTRSMFGTEDMQAQHDLLNEVSRLVDAGTLRTTLTETYGAINAANLRRAHKLIESGTARGKVVLEGF